jgi:hypothetical protein
MQTMKQKKYINWVKAHTWTTTQKHLTMKQEIIMWKAQDWKILQNVKKYINIKTYDGNMMIKSK